jgi:hypothetical protein
MGIFNLFKSKNSISETKDSKNLEYDKIKKLSYWIFNNYGIPVSKGVNAFDIKNERNVIISPRLPFKTDRALEKRLFSVRTIQQVINSYLLEYSGQTIDFQPESFYADYVQKEESMFKLIEKEIYTGVEYNYLESNYNTHLFLTFDFDKLDSENNSIKISIQRAKDKTTEYIETFGDTNKPKLICPSSGLKFEEYKDDGIKEEAKFNKISFEEQLRLVKDEVEQLNNRFIPQTLIYCSPLMDMVRWQVGFNYIDTNNNIIFEPSGTFYGERN